MGWNTGGVLITGFATGPAATNCYFVAPRAGAGALVIDPADEAVPTLEYYFTVNDLTPVAVLLTGGAPEHSACAFDVCEGWDIPLYLRAADRALLDDTPEQVVEITDGQQLELGGIAVTADYGPAAVMYRVTADTDEGPIGVAFTGDALDARCSGDPVYRDNFVREKMLILDDRTVVLPGHGPSTTVGALRRRNLTKD